jgi:hypothetical protein
MYYPLIFSNLHALLKLRVVENIHKCVVIQESLFVYWMVAYVLKSDLYFRKRHQYYPKLSLTKKNEKVKKIEKKEKNFFLFFPWITYITESRTP